MSTDILWRLTNGHFIIIINQSIRGLSSRHKEYYCNIHHITCRRLTLRWPVK